MILSEIIHVTSRQILEIQLANLPLNSIVLFDIDDTLITPVSSFFRIEPYRSLIDEIKKNPHQYPDYEEIISNWRLQRKVMLVDPKWPETIQLLKSKHQVYGFTKMDTGKFGNITSVETWRYQELKNLGVEFSQKKSIEEFQIGPGSFKNSPMFYKGIFFTGSASKAEMFALYQNVLNNSFIVLIDDREEHLLDLGAFCREVSIPFRGFLFKASWLTPTFKTNSPMAEFQKTYLLEHKKWIEDEDANTKTY